MRSGGFVLVGGRSSRMGADKALLPFQGLTLAATLAHRLLQIAGHAVLVGDPVKYAHLGFPVIPDLNPGNGPLAGIEAALSSAIAEWSLILACDLPSIPDHLLSTLVAAIPDPPAALQCIVPVSPAAIPQPLCAVYRRSCLPAVRSALAAGQLRVKDLFPQFQVRQIPAPLEYFANVNTPADWARLLNRPVEAAP